ncbi:dipeptidase PepE [Shewanella sp. NIFS-20-20]|uniref:dipeptidase PepE n=1 Tax=Shewanella sp. NIFS-20-20 TaxID=2853806 RepID=UPI001C436CED|nr:dipeptidase PepE [Shewanella sp. NIFS-20-20]MBV7317205.1 dipeptidase PepE [Shewanella sp. NIFS-20-20]
MTTQVLLLSSSKLGDTPYLSHAIDYIAPYQAAGTNWLFIPFAGVGISYDDYLAKVQSGLGDLNIQLSSIHQHSDYHQAIKAADVILVGGGNTFHLLHELYRHDLLGPIQEAVATGTPYIGWSAGSNIAGLSIRTTNDMPIIAPPSFEALQLVPFQLNPHYTDYIQPGHNGETRAQRIFEFTCVDSHTPVVGIVEGSALQLAGQQLRLLGKEPGYYFCGEIQQQVIAANSDLSHLLA